VVNAFAALDGSLHGVLAVEAFGQQDAGRANILASRPFRQALIARILRKDLAGTSTTDA